MNASRWAGAVWCAGLVACAAGQDASVGEPYAQPLGGSAVRFFESQEAFRAAPPSVVLEGQPREGLPMPEHFSLRPGFSASAGQRTVAVKAPAGTSFYGLGEADGGFLRNGFKGGPTGVECPWVLGVRPDGSAFGVLMDTGYACRVDLTSGVTISTDAPRPGVIVLDAPGPREALVMLSELTGRMEMPPRWALGAGVEPRQWDPGVPRRVRDANLSVDYVVLRDATELVSCGGKPGPAWAGLAEGLKETHLHAVGRLGPALPAGGGTPLFDSGAAGDAWIRDGEGPAVLGERAVRMVLPDYTRSAVRTWWSDAVFESTKLGVDGVLVMPIGSPVPGEAMVRADAELGGPGKVEQYRAVLPSQWLRASREGFRPEQRDRRPWVAQIGFAIPHQRWSASQVVEGSGHELALPSTRVDGALSLSLSGQPLALFRPAGDASEEDSARSVGLAALMPMCVAGALRFDDAAPVGPDRARVLRTALARRSRLIPYCYTLCFYAFRDCEPILRPLFFADPRDLSLRDRADAFFLGADVLVVPRPAGDKPKPSCPLKGGWRRLDWGDGEQPDLPDLYLRPGAILPLGPAMQHTSERPVDPLTLVINLDESGVAVGSLYEDDGEGYAFYRNQCRRLGYRAERKDDAVFVRLSNLDGGMPIPRRGLEVRVLTDAGVLSAKGSERGTVKIDLPKDAPKPP